MFSDNIDVKVPDLGSVKNPSAGLSAIELIIVLSIFGGLLTGVMSTVFQVSRTTRTANQYSDVLALKIQMTSVLQKEDLCTAQLNPADPRNALNPNLANLHFDSTSATPEIDVKYFWTSGTYDPNKFLAAEYTSGAPPAGAPDTRTTTYGLQIDKITLSDIQKVPNSSNPYRWQGNWTITFKDPIGGLTPSPIKIHQNFYIDSASAAATPTAVTIQKCQTPVQVGFVASCPAGFSIVGQPNQSGTFCIDTASRTPAQFFDSKFACAALALPGFGPGHLCDQNEFFAACNQGSPSGMIGTEVWIDDFDTAFGSTAGKANCSWSNDKKFKGTTTALNFFCCLG